MKGFYYTVEIIGQSATYKSSKYYAGFTDSLWVAMYGGSNTGQKRPRLKQFLMIGDLSKTVDVETYLDEIGFVAA